MFLAKQPNLRNYPQKPALFSTITKLQLPSQFTLIFNYLFKQMHNIQKPTMSNKFSSTGTTFGPSNLFRQEELIREIVQNEVFLIFEDIKLEIESKIKSIDRNIIELRNQVRRISQGFKNHQDLAEFVAKIDKIEAQMQLLRYHQQFQLKTSRTKSLDKERKPIFRKNSSEHQDFSSVILGLETEPKQNLEWKIKEKSEMMLKPPLPRQSSRPKSQVSLKPDKQSDSKSQKRNLVLQDSGTIHRWLHENNNRQPSCFSSIIRQQDIEESVFY